MLEQRIRKLQAQFKQHADPKTKKWFENYLKGVISYYGIKTPVVKQIVVVWRKENKIDQLSVKEQLALCEQLFSLEHAEEKFAATMYIESYLIKVVNTKTLLKFSANLYRKNYIYDWSTADWYSMRVLTNLIRHDNNVVSKIAFLV